MKTRWPHKNLTEYIELYRFKKYIYINQICNPQALASSTCLVQWVFLSPRTILRGTMEGRPVPQTHPSCDWNQRQVQSLDSSATSGHVCIDTYVSYVYYIYILYIELYLIYVRILRYIIYVHPVTSQERNSLLTGHMMLLNSNGSVPATYHN